MAGKELQMPKRNMRNDQGKNKPNEKPAKKLVQNMDMKNARKIIQNAQIERSFVFHNRSKSVHVLELININFFRKKEYDKNCI